MSHLIQATSAQLLCMAACKICKAGISPIYLIAVLVVLEACVVVHKTVKFLKTLVLLLCLQNRDEMQTQLANS